MWTRAEELALDAQVRAKGSSAIEPGSRWRATKGWWYGFKRRHPKVVMRIKEALATGPFSGAPPDGGRQETTSFLSTLL